MVFPIERLNKIGLRSLMFWFTLANFQPFTFTQLSFHPGPIIFLIFGMIMVMDLVSSNKLRIDPTVGVTIYSILAFQLILLYIHDDMTYVSYFIGFGVSCVAFLYGYTFLGIRKMAEQFVSIMTVMLFLSTVAFILAFLGVLEPLSEHFNRDGRIAYNYIFTFTNSQLSLPHGIIMRPAGYFDEPGTLAFFSFYAVMINEIYLKKKNKTLQLVLLTIPTMSMAFFILIFGYISYKLIFSLKGILLLITVTIMFSFLGTYMRNNQTSPASVILYRKTFGRFEKDKTTGEIQGDNRSELMELSKETFLKNPYWGVGRRDSNKNGFMGANGIFPFARDGIVGGLLYYSPYLILWIFYCFNTLKQYKFNHKEFVLFILLGINYLQRPNLADGIDVVCILLLVLLYFESSKVREERQVMNHCIKA